MGTPRDGGCRRSATAPTVVLVKRLSALALLVLLVSGCGGDDSRLADAAEACGADYSEETGLNFYNVREDADAMEQFECALIELETSDATRRLLIDDVENTVTMGPSVEETSGGLRYTTGFTSPTRVNATIKIAD